MQFVQRSLPESERGEPVIELLKKYGIKKVKNFSPEAGALLTTNEEGGDTAAFTKWTEAVRPRAACRENTPRQEFLAVSHVGRGGFHRR